MIPKIGLLLMIIITIILQIACNTSYTHTLHHLIDSINHCYEFCKIYYKVVYYVFLILNCAYYWLKIVYRTNNGVIDILYSWAMTNLTNPQ